MCWREKTTHNGGQLVVANDATGHFARLTCETPVPRAMQVTSRVEVATGGMERCGRRTERTAPKQIQTLPLRAPARNITWRHWRRTLFWHPSIGRMDGRGLSSSVAEEAFDGWKMDRRWWHGKMWTMFGAQVTKRFASTDRGYSLHVVGKWLVGTDSRHTCVQFT